MKKGFYIFILMIFYLNINSQNELKKPSNINHLIGIDFGYTKHNVLVGNKGDINLNYVFNPHLFCFKTQLGVAPATNFGNLYKVFLSVGFSTKTNKLISWHLLAGFGSIEASKNYNLYINNSTPTSFKFYAKSLIIESGFYLKPLKNNNIIFGINSVAYRLNINNPNRGTKSSYLTDAITLNINLSLNIKLNR